MMLEINTALADIREVGGDDLDGYTRRGYKLLCILQEKHVGVERESVPCSGPTQDRPCEHNMYHPSHCSYEVYRDVVGERLVTRYVIGRDPEDALAEMATKADDLQAEVYSLRREASEARTAREEAEKERDQARESLTEAEGNVKTLSDQIVEEKSATKREQKIVTGLKRDIEKLSAEFGAREVRRVLDA
jgi:hypothetical protein